ncbi:MAG: hypothetical protein N2235_18905, partial [Fischerella sp.]|nr:hypothetical protein [Fischerella sp.]
AQFAAPLPDSHADTAFDQVVAERKTQNAAANNIDYGHGADTPVAICYRLGWPDEKIWIVPLDKMSEHTYNENLIRTTLYVISPALGEAIGRSRLYHPEHTHLFRARE